MKIAFCIQYNGFLYCGYSEQLIGLNIQTKIEKSISIINNDPVIIKFSGKTDKGVHSIGQIINFDTNKRISLKNWKFGINYYLPNDIRVIWLKYVSNSFNSRFSAISRYYRYLIYNSNVKNKYNLGINIIKYPINSERMYLSCKILMGENNFSSFEKFNSTNISPYRKIMYVKIKRKKKYILIDIKANSFLYNMIRIIIGNLLEIGKGYYNEYWIKYLLHLKSNKYSLPMSESKGLYFMKVEYPKFFFETK